MQVSAILLTLKALSFNLSLQGASGLCTTITLEPIILNTVLETDSQKSIIIQAKKILKYSALKN